MGSVWLLHVAVHTLLLWYFVPFVVSTCFSKPEAPAQDLSGHSRAFKETATHIPSNWFNTNPVHCVRSKAIHKHKPHMMLWVSGKEHLQERNPDIHCHFHSAVVLASSES